MSYCFYDENRVRYQLYKTNPGNNINWIYLSAGPGADSSYLKSLIDVAQTEGNHWLIDLPGSGSYRTDPNYDFRQWLEIFLPVVARFENAVLVGHSFGGIFPMLFPKLEDYLKGLVILGSCPSLWLEASAKLAIQDRLPDISNEIQGFLSNPNDHTFAKYLEASMPYYFPRESIERGKSLLLELPFQYQTAGWWQKYLIETQYTAQWVPQSLPMMVIGGGLDYITPISIYENDQRFKRSNIQIFKIEEGGHLPWMERPETIHSLFQSFCEKISF